MSISQIQYNTLLARIEALERRIERAETAINNLVSMDQVTALGLVRQTEISDLTTRMEAVEQQVTALETFHQT
jgi:polyhydroxyalkanoate synthesis regulator phasin